MDVVPDRSRPALATIGAIRIHRLAGSPPTYSFFEDLREETGTATKHEAADLLTRVLAQRRPDLQEWIDVDSEAGGVGVTSESLEPLREVAELLGRLRELPRT